MDPVSRPRWMLLLCALVFPAPAAAETVHEVFAGSSAAGLGGAYDALEAGEPELALTRLATAAPDLHVWTAFVRAQALLALKRPAEAIDALNAAPLPPSCGAGHPQDGPRVELRSRALLARSPQRALGVASSTVGESGAPLAPNPEFWSWLWTEAAGSDAQLIWDLQRRTLLQAPLSKAAKELAASGAVNKLSREERRDRVEALLAAHDNATAFAEAAALKPRNVAERCQLELVQGIAERKQRRYTSAIKFLRKARRGCLKADEPARARRAALWEQRVRGIIRDVKGTLRVARWFEKKWPHHSFVDDLWFLHARTLEGRNRKAEAHLVYERLAKNTPSGDMIPSAAWRQAQQALQAKNNHEARVHLKRILNARPARAMDVDRAQYWLAQTATAAERWTALETLAGKPSFYGWVALHDLELGAPKRAKKVTTKLLSVAALSESYVALPGVWQQRSELRHAALFAADGLLSEAMTEIDQLACSDKAPGLRVALAAAYGEIGRRQPRNQQHAAPDAHRRAQMAIRSESTSLLKRFDKQHLPAWRLAYSRPFRPLVELAATQAKVEALLLFALAREESTFDPDIISWAGATGLTQVMPSTAIGAYADVYRRRLKDMSLLRDPKLNLRLGAHVLRTGMRRFGKVPLALSAYNGGVGLTKKTLSKKPQTFVNWAEGNPVRENRRYVKKVVQSWGIYRLLYDRKRPFIELPKKIPAR